MNDEKDLLAESFQPNKNNLEILGSIVELERSEFYTPKSVKNMDAQILEIIDKVEDYE